MFGRLLTAMVTPFDREDRIDWDQTARLVDYLIEEQRSDGLIVAGTTGESATLSDEEKLKLFEFVVKQAAGRCWILAGTGSFDTSHSVHLTRQAERTGVDGFLVVTPYYNRPGQGGLYKHFEKIAGATTKPVILYNIPSRTGIHMNAETTAALSQIPNIVATKESHSDFDHLTRIVREAADGFRVYSGDDGLLLPMLSIGAYGVVSVASHVIGKEMKRLIEYFLQGNVAEAAKLHGRLHPMIKGLFECPHRVPNPAPVKHALKLKGIDAGKVRLPLEDVTEAEGEYIAKLLS